MRVCLIDSSVRLKKGTTVNVHEHNCRIIKRFLERKNIFCTFYHCNDEVNVNDQFDIMLLSYASFYMKFEKFVRLIENQKNCKIGWITNEYNLEANSSFKKFITFFISNFEQYGKYLGTNYLMVNLNSLIMKEPREKYSKKFDVIYYGTYRPNREVYFQKYLKNDLILSTSNKNMKRYKSLGCSCKFINKLNWRVGAETLNLFRSSLYIEDERTHDLYNHLANRFYESLIYNCVPFFDLSCMNTINKSGYEIDPFFVVESYEELMNKARQVPNDFTNKFMVKWSQRAIQEKEVALNSIYNFIREL